MQAADAAAAAAVGATSRQADRTARRSGPQYGRERRMDNAPVPPIWPAVSALLGRHACCAEQGDLSGILASRASSLACKEFRLGRVDRRWHRAGHRRSSRAIITGERSEPLGRAIASSSRPAGLARGRGVVVCERRPLRVV